MKIIKGEHIKFGKQISIFDILERNETKTPNNSKKILKQITYEKNEKVRNPFKLPALQHDFLTKNNVLKNENLSRLIQYCGGGLGIETKESNGFRTTYINKEGEEEFTKDKRFPVLPMDKILYCKSADILFSSLQEERLQGLKAKYPVAKIIRRKGDENVILILKDKVISITPKRVLEFQNIKVAYEESEVLQDHEEIVDIEAIQKRVKVGDIVEVVIGKEKLLVRGKITRVYGMGNYILNIDYKNKHTAIGRYAVRKIIAAA